MSSTLLENLSDCGCPPYTRITSATAASSLWKALVDDDQKASKSRAHLEAMLGGAPPWIQEILDSSGQADKCNLNFQEGKSVIEAAQTPFYELTNATETLITNIVNAGEPHLRGKYSHDISVSFTKTVKRWQGFEFNRQLLSREFVVHGLGVAYFDDPYDFRFSVAGLADWKIPRNTKADIDQIPYAGIQREYPVDVLYSYIKDREVALSAGWNVEAVQQAIKSAIETKTGNEFKDWEEVELMISQNDLLIGRSEAEVVRVVHMYVKEFDGSVSHMMILPDGCQEFLYQHIGRFENMRQAMIVFAFGVGKGYYHTIRGAGDTIYSIVQTQNRLRCQAYDCANGAASVMLQPTDNSGRALEDLTLTQIGPYQILPPGVQVIERSLPNLAHSVIPIIQDMSNVLRQISGPYQQRLEGGRQGPERRQLEVQLEAQREATLGSSAVNLFYAPLDLLYAEMFRRLSREHYNSYDPDAEFVIYFRSELARRGVPLEALYSCTDVQAARAIGSGSSSKRVVALNTALQFAGSMTEVGRVNLIRDVIATNMEYSQIDRYIPEPTTVPVEPIDVQMAGFENNFMRQKMKVSVGAGQSHTLHLMSHIMDTEGVLMMLQQGSMSPVDTLAYFSLMIPHCQEHLAMLTSDSTNADMVASVTQRLQQLTAMAERLNNEIQAAMQRQKQQEEAEMQRQMQAEQARIAELEQKAAAAEETDPKLSIKLQKELMAFQNKMEMEKQLFQQRLAQQQAEFAQKLAFKDLETAKVLSNVKPE